MLQHCKINLSHCIWHIFRKTSNILLYYRNDVTLFRKTFHSLKNKKTKNFSLSLILSNFNVELYMELIQKFPTLTLSNHLWLDKL